MVKVIHIGPTEGINFHNKTKNLPLIVKVFHPNCGHCIKLEPEWNKFANILKKNYDGDIGVVSIHADALADIESNGLNNIQGYPTIRIIKNNNLVDEYNDERNNMKMLNYSLKHFNIKKKKQSKKKQSKKKQSKKKQSKKKQSKKETIQKLVKI